MAADAAQCVHAQTTAAPGWQLDNLTPTPVAIADDKGITELSGLAYSGENGLFYAISDTIPKLARLRITIDEATASATATVVGEVRLRSKAGRQELGTLDGEGLAWLPASGHVLVSDERFQTLREYDPVSGNLQRRLRAIDKPELLVHDRQVYNRGWEAVAWSSGNVWLINEQALKPDQDLDRDDRSSLPIRLQRLDSAELTPTGQWAYPLNSWLGGIQQTHGVAGMEALPDGRLLILERAAELHLLSMGKAIRHRIYLIDTSKATDVTDKTSLVGADFVPVRKTLLWEQTFANHNFEGMSFGPPLAGNALSLVLVSDNGQGLAQGILVLRLSPAP